MKKTDDTVSLTVNGKVISGWDTVRVTRGIERFPSDFDIGLMDYYPGSEEKQIVQDGYSCIVKFGSDLVITGYVDDWSPSSIVPGMRCTPPGGENVKTWLTALLSGLTTS
jgi:prophage tail gpP-like protein